MAIGVATVLGSSAGPDPLSVELRGQSIDQAAYFIRAVVRECANAEISLKRVQVDDELFEWLANPSAEQVAATLAGGGEPGAAKFFRKSDL